MVFHVLDLIMRNMLDLRYWIIIMIKKLKVYKGAEHNHEAQKPEILVLKEANK